MAGSAAIRGLQLAVRPRVVAKYLGQAFLMLAALTLIPAAVSGLAGETAVALRYLAVVLVFSVYGAATARIRVTADMQRNEALVITALVFMLPGFVMAFPLAGYGLPFIDALFEAISGITTTGLSTLGSVTDRPAAFLFARAWLQWVGGLGVLALVLALLIDPGGVAGKRLGFDERVDIAGGTRTHLRRVAQVYLIITAAGMLALLAVGARPLDAVVHTLTAVSTGGFGNYDASLAAIASWQERALVTLLSMAGAISFSWYYLGYYRHLPSLLREPQFRSLIVLCTLTVTALFGFLSLAHPEHLAGNLADALMMGVSAQTTTGFSSLPPATLDAGSKLTLIIAMFIGGEAGSTAGGLKVWRLMVLLATVRLLVQKTAVPPSGRITATVGGQSLQSSEIITVVTLLVIYLLVVLLSWLAFLVRGYAPLDALFEIVSALATTGLSTGISSATLEPALKSLLCLDMLLGRVEVVAFLVLLYPRTWWGRKRG